MWKLRVGDKVSWETLGRNKNQRSGTIVGLIPAGIPADTIAVSAPINRGTVNISQVDRYAIEVEKQNARGNPVPGKTTIMLPNRWALEKAVEGNS